MPKLENYDDTRHPLTPAAAASLATRNENINRNDSTTNDAAVAVAATAHAGAATASSGVESQVANTNTDWINNRWRPVSGWTYLAICIFDFIVAPVLWSLIQAQAHGVVSTQWQPLTLQGGGLVHVSFGALLGITSWGRSREKLEGKA
jgi:hypothetical protein